MFVLTNVVGTIYAVYDDTDNSVEWINLDTLKKLISNGINITGINLANNEIKPQIVVLNYKDINWNDGKNIFQTATTVHIDNKGNLLLKAGVKKYKAKILMKDDGSAMLLLSNGIQTVLPAEIVGYLNSKR